MVYINMCSYIKKWLNKLKGFVSGLKMQSTGQTDGGRGLSQDQEQADNDNDNDNHNSTNNNNNNSNNDDQGQRERVSRL